MKFELHIHVYFNINYNLPISFYLLFYQNFSYDILRALSFRLSISFMYAFVYFSILPDVILFMREFSLCFHCFFFLLQYDIHGRRQRGRGEGGCPSGVRTSGSTGIGQRFGGGEPPPDPLSSDLFRLQYIIKSITYIMQVN